MMEHCGSDEDVLKVNPVTGMPLVSQNAGQNSFEVKERPIFKIMAHTHKVTMNNYVTMGKKLNIDLGTSHPDPTSNESLDLIQEPPHKQRKLSAEFKLEKDIFTKLQVIGQIDKKFIATRYEHDDFDGMKTLIVWDQHAVDERINLELFLRRFVNSQGELTISDSTDLAVKKLIDLKCEKSLRNENCVFMSPISVEHYSKLCSDACRKAIKFGQSLSKAEMENLIVKLGRCQLPFQCAHGRPTVAVVCYTQHLLKMDTYPVLSNLSKKHL